MTPGQPAMQFQVSLDPAQSRLRSPVILHVQNPTGLPLNPRSPNPQVTSQGSYLSSPCLEFQCPLQPTAQLQPGTHLPNNRVKDESSICSKIHYNTRFWDPTVQHLQLRWGIRPQPP